MSAPAPCSGEAASRHALIISYAPITDAPRVRRQAQLLLSQGWRVTLAGRAGRSAAPDGCDVVEMERRFRARGYAGRAVFALLQVLSSLSGALAEWIYWRNSIVRHSYRPLAGLTGDLVICHDYITTPTALKVAQRSVAPSWEVKQSADDPVPASGARRAAFIAALARVRLFPGNALDIYWRLPAAPLVVRSTPPWEAPGEHVTTERVRVLYHGLMREGRGLEALVQAVAAWPEGWTLSLRGPAREGYLESLRRVARARAVERRLELLPPVPMTELVSAARPFDVGVFCADGSTSQARFVLPNKLFEYIVAGLAVCVSNLPEMARVVREHRVGWLVPEATPDAIARTLAVLGPCDVQRAREASRTAAKTLCWEVEQQVLPEAMARAAGRDGSRWRASARHGAGGG